jgi:hypothetical protein
MLWKDSVFYDNFMRRARVEANDFRFASDRVRQVVRQNSNRNAPPVRIGKEAP